ncbi:MULTISPECIES: SF1B family DNA helicase RecD2 [unclassified Psychrobacillus]|uniref:SF1B family DNA helicase RecD2 n=1 Tax=unclassified Psychrobacillus TaxID=2636677 RepID=UPI0030FB2A8D
MTGMFNVFNDLNDLNEGYLAGKEIGERLTITGIVRDEFYYDNINRFGVYSIELDDMRTKVSGEFPYQLKVGQTYQIRGKVYEYKEELQLKADAVYPERPSTKEGIVAFLQTLHGLNIRANLLYETYGMDVINILMKEPERIAEEVRGIGAKSVKAWQEQLVVLQDDYHSLMRLMGLGLSMRDAEYLFKRFGESAAESIEQNPYWLQIHLKGYSFKACDKVAATMDFPGDAPERIEGGILFVLERFEWSGHCYTSDTQLKEELKKLLELTLTYQEVKDILKRQEGPSLLISYRSKRYKVARETLEKHARRFPIVRVSDKLIDESIEILKIANKIVVEESRIYLPETYDAEVKSAIAVGALKRERVPFSQILEPVAREMLLREKVSLENKQMEAVERFTSEQGGMHLLDGSAGCGKTFTLNIILKVIEEKFRRTRLPFEYMILAPTGRAAKVASQSTGRPAQTIHRALGYSDGKFEHHSNNPLSATCYVIDETSMIDIHLIASLLDAIPNGAKVIFMGDGKQLESVGPGAVLLDLIASGVLDHVTLDVVKRQALDSAIIRNANRIIRGETIERESSADAHFVRRNTKETFQKGIVESVLRMVGTYSLDDMQVLLPMKRGESGTYVINFMLQQALNPHKEGERILNRIVDRENADSVSLYFQEGDKVIQMKNNYGMEWFENKSGRLEKLRLKGVMNGEIGFIEKIEKKSTAIGHAFVTTVRFQEGLVFYEGDLRELDHAYAMTIHKSQGSQWPFVILGLTNDHYPMLQNSILYTGYTRAKDLVLAIGNEEAFDRAARNFTSKKRRTTLAAQLQASI